MHQQSLEVRIQSFAQRTQVGIEPEEGTVCCDQFLLFGHQPMFTSSSRPHIYAAHIVHGLGDDAPLEVDHGLLVLVLLWASLRRGPYPSSAHTQHRMRPEAAKLRSTSIGHVLLNPFVAQQNGTTRAPCAPCSTQILRQRSFQSD